MAEHTDPPTFTRNQRVKITAGRLRGEEGYALECLDSGLAYVVRVGNHGTFRVPVNGLAAADGKTCTCGAGPWSAAGVCEACGGIDLGLSVAIAVTSARRFKPGQPVRTALGQGEVIGANTLDCEYIVHVENAGTFRFAESALSETDGNTPRQLDFATDETLVERLRRIEDDARYVRGHIESVP